MPNIATLTPEQKQLHLNAYVFYCRHFLYKSVTEWNFDAIHQELDALEEHRGTAYPTP